MPDPLNELISSAIAHHQQGRLSHAEQCYLQIAMIKPDWAEVHNNLGASQQGQNRFSEATESYRRAILLDPNHAVAHHNLGTIYHFQGNLDDAESHYRQAIAITPEYAEAHSNLGNILLQRGKLEEAIAEYRQALSINLQFAEAHNNLGSALKSQGKLEAAAASYEQAITLNPSYADALNNLGCVRLDQARFDEAMASLDRALQLKPDFAEAHCNRGVALKETGQLEEAMKSFERAIALKPDYADAFNNCAGILKDDGRLEEALGCCDRALAINPRFAAAHCNRGGIWLDQGQLERASGAFRTALECKPGFPEAIYNLSRLKTFQSGDPDLAELQSIDAAALPASKQPFVHFALSKAFEDLKDYRRSFEQLLQGNRTKRQSVVYNEPETLGYFQQIADVFNAEFFDRDHGQADASETPVFILGMPRSGSTLVEQILASHPQIQACGELHSLARVINNSEYPAGYSSIDQATIGRLGRSYLQALPEMAPGKLRMTDKMPGNFVYIGLIHLMLPNARIIHTMRNPVDTCVSCFSTLFNSGMPYSCDLAELGRYHRGYRQLMDHWKSVLPAGRIIEVSYENLIDDPEAQARRLIQHCGLDWDDRCLQFHNNGRAVSTASNVQVRKPISRGSVHRWKRYEEFLQPLLAELHP